MSYCFGPKSKGYISELTTTQKLIPNKYLLYKCLLDKRRTFFSITNNDQLKIYSDKGLLKQLDLFKLFINKFQYIEIEDNFFIVPKSNISFKKDLLLYKYIFYNKNTNNLLKNKNVKFKSYISFILSGETKKISYNINVYQIINKSKIKTPKNLNAKQEFEYKRNYLIKNGEIDKFKKEFDNNYKKSKELIKTYENDKDFLKFFKQESKKFKIKSFEKEIKEIKKSVFFTCKVATKYKKLFPNY